MCRNVGPLDEAGAESGKWGGGVPLGTWTRHPAPSPTAAFQAGAADEVISSGSPRAKAAGCPLPPRSDFSTFEPPAPQKEYFMAKAFPGLAIPTAFELLYPCPNHSRPAKSEAYFLDRETEAQRGKGTDLEATAARNAARAL